MVLSGRKWPPSRSVAAPRTSRARPVSTSASSKPEPRRAALHRRVPGRRVGADADERGLAERGQPADAGEQHEAERGKRIDADVVHQRDGEGAEQSRRDRDEGNGEPEQDVGPPAHQASPRGLRLRSLPRRRRWHESDCQISTGISALNTSTSLSALLQNDAKLSSNPTRMAPTAVAG